MQVFPFAFAVRPVSSHRTFSKGGTNSNFIFFVDHPVLTIDQHKFLDIENLCRNINNQQKQQLTKRQLSTIIHQIKRVVFENISSVLENKQMNLSLHPKSES